MANSYLSRTQTAGNRTTFTFSAWVKRSGFGTQHLITCGASSTYMTQFQFNSADQLQFYNNDNGTTMHLQSNRKFRDTNAWYHIVLRFDTTQSTTNDRIRFYVNGEQVTSFATQDQPTQNADNTQFNYNGVAVDIGRRHHDNSDYFNGYMSHASFVDGQALAPTVFGETDSTSGIWKFKQPSGVTWGTNGFHLKFENSSALGTDSSGNSNTFTVNGNGRQALDTPSNVYAVLNTLNPATDKTISMGGDRIVGSNATNYSDSISATLAAETGKWYWEVKYTSANSNTNCCVGAAKTENYEYNQNITSGTGGYVSFRFDGERQINSAATGSYFPAPSAGDIFMFALDMTNLKFWLGKNGAWYGTTGNTNGDPANGTNPSATLTAGAWTPVIRYLAGTFDCNFGNGYFGTTAITSAGSNGNGSLFEYDVPSGYYALNTKNINTYG